jgi:uncharacterized protein (TIGR02271 family)
MGKTVVGLFDNRAEAQTVVQELLAEGFRREHISIMSKRIDGQDVNVQYVEEDGHAQIEDMARGAGTGAAIGGAAGLFLSVVAGASVPGIGPVLAAGPLAAILAGAGIGATAGGLISGLTRLGVPDDDANFYAEGLRRGGTLVSVEASDDTAARAVAVMKHHGAVEIDKRSAEWREQGWTGFDEETFRPHVTPPSELVGDAGRRAERAEVTERPNRFVASEVTAEHSPVNPALAAGQSAHELRVPVSEEELRVGKREVERGGVRVERRVEERPVEQQVNLREERVQVERRPVDYTFHGSELEAFKEGQLEIREAYEELIVNKKARVVEEIVINKNVEERTETVRDRLRRTEVNVEPLEPGRARGAAAAEGGGDNPRRADEA